MNFDQLIALDSITIIGIGIGAALLALLYSSLLMRGAYTAAAKRQVICCWVIALLGFTAVGGGLMHEYQQDKPKAQEIQRQNG